MQTVKKKHLMILIILMSTILTMPFASGAIKAGSLCPKLGKSITSNGTRFSCVSKGKKLVWKSEIPISDITDFRDLPTRFGEIHKIVWEKSRKLADKPSSLSSPTEIVIGPHSFLYSQHIQESIAMMQKLYQGADFPKKTWWIVDTGDDLEWAKETFRKLLLPIEVNADSGYGTNSKEEAVVNKRVDSNLQNQLVVTSGASDAHGYMHALQVFQFRNSTENWGNVPRWLLEGSASFSDEFALWGSDYQTYLIHRESLGLHEFDRSFFDEFIRYIPKTELQDGANEWSYTNKWPEHRVYDVGSLVCEVLIAIKDPASILNLYKDFAVTGDFDASFKNVYGVSWSFAEPYVSETVFKMINGK